MRLEVFKIIFLFSLIGFSQKKVEDIKTENTDIYNIPDPDEDDKIINLKKE